MLPAPTESLSFRRIWNLTWPLVLSNTLDLTAALVDLLLVRSFGPAATAAIGVSRQVTFVVEAVAAAIVTGTLTLVSQGTGARSASQLEAVLRQSIWLVLLLGIPASLAGFLLSGPILLALQVDAHTLARGEPYLNVYFAGLLFLWGNLVGAAICRGAGDVWTPLKLNLGVSLLNIGLSYLFIHGAGPVPGFGVMGAALGALGARFCGGLIYLILFRRGVSFLLPERDSTAPLPTDEPRGWGIDLRLMLRLLRIGVPMALANVLRHGSRLVFLAIVGASVLGVSFQAAVGMGMQLRLVGLVVALAFQTATATLVGQALGQGDLDRAELLGWRGVQLLGLVMAALLGTIMVLAEPLAALFIAAPEAAELGSQVLRWFAAAQFFSALSIGLQGALLGAGDTVPALRYTLISEWGVMLSLAAIFLVTGWWFPDSLLLAWLVAPILTLILMYRRWRGGRWKVYWTQLLRQAR